MNKERLKANQRRWEAKNRDKIRETAHAYYMAHRQSHIEYTKQYYLNNNVGYNLGNCIPACATCNKMRMNMSISNFVSQINSISK